MYQPTVGPGLGLAGPPPLLKLVLAGATFGKQGNSSKR